MKLNTLMALFISFVVAIGMAIILVVNFFVAKEEMYEAEFERARSFVLAAEGVREWGAEQLKEGVFATERVKNDVGKFLYTVPVIGALKVMELKSDEADFGFKVPKFQPRNPKNEPDSLEAEILRKLSLADTGSGSTPEYKMYDKEKKVLRYFKAIRLTKECEMCHGDPATAYELWGTPDGTDPTGVVMENWRAGQIHGAFEIFLSTDKAHAMLKSGLLTYIAIFIPITIFLIICIFILNKQMIFRRLDMMDKVFSSIAEGDYTQRVQVSRHDEIGKLGISVNKMTESSSNTLAAVINTISSLATTAEELSTNADIIAKNTLRQAEQTASTAAAMEQISTTVSDVALTSHNVNTNTEQARENVIKGHLLVNETREMMERIAFSVKDASDTVRKLGESSEQIGQIVQVIDDIADQTNLLALNAAIEAARAGEHGRGFAVVADEVRKLAEKTVKATKEIADMIQNIQADTGGAVASMFEGVHQVEDGKVKAVDAGEALDIIKENINDVSEEVRKISLATEEQANSVALMSSNIENISSTSSENSLSVRESAKAIEQLNSLAHELQQSVARFKLH
jgi:methyl-accepting chemotaxis protein